jgi:hypothetical protein
VLCSVSGCSAPAFVKKRQLCQRHYVELRNSGVIPQKRESTTSRAGLSDTWHRAEDLHEGTMTADCSICGPGTPMVVKLDGRPVCTNGTRESRYRMKYRLSPARLAMLMLRAGNACEICREPVNGRTMRIDHDHKCCAGPTKTCGKCTRGVLCHRCNVALGFMQDDPDRLRAAIEYLARNSSPLYRG